MVGHVCDSEYAVRWSMISAKATPAAAEQCSAVQEEED